MVLLAGEGLFLIERLERTYQRTVKIVEYYRKVKETDF